MKKKLFLALFMAYVCSQPFANAHPGFHPESQSKTQMEMTPDQQIVYKKTVASVLDFLEQFHSTNEDYKESLEKLKNQLIFSYDHPYRTRQFCNAFALCRDDYVGIKLKEMTEAQQTKFSNLMQTLLASYGYQKMEKVFSRQPIIFDIEQAYRENPEKFPAVGGQQGTPLESWKPIDANGNPVARDANDYYIAFFGDLEAFVNGSLTPNTQSQNGFGIRIEGHHLSLNFTFVNKDNHLVISSSPTFYGSNPMVVPPAPVSAPGKFKNWKLKVGDTFMLSETQIAKLFIQSLTAEEQKIGQYSHMGAPMFESAAEQKPAESQSYIKGNTEGLKIADLQGTKKEIEQKKYLLLEFLKLISATQRETILNLIDLNEDMDDMRISFYGKLDKFDEFYFRIQSKKFLLELVQSTNFSIANPGNESAKNDPLNNGLYNNNHVHIMFRDLRNDWGYDSLFLHEKQDHHKQTLDFKIPVM